MAESGNFWTHKHRKCLPAGTLGGLLIGIRRRTSRRMPRLANDLEGIFVPGRSPGNRRQNPASRKWDGLDASGPGFHMGLDDSWDPDARFKDRCEEYRLKG